MIVKRLARYGWLLIVLALPRLAMGQQDPGLTAGLEEKLSQFDRKKTELEELQRKVTIQGSVLNARALSQYLLTLAMLKKELAVLLEDVEKDLGRLEAKPEILIDMRRRLDAMKVEVAKNKPKDEFSQFVHAGPKYFFDLLKLPDGRTLVRNGPTETYLPAKLGLTNQPTPCVNCTVYSLGIFAVDDRGEITPYLSLAEVVSPESWKDLDIQVSRDWQRIGVYKQNQDGSWVSEFWRLAKDRYERAAGPSNEAPPKR
jgi:hypothetical protein